MTQKRNNQKRKPVQTKMDTRPTLLKYLIKNINNGVLPDESDFDEIQRDLGKEWFADINKALLAYIKKGNLPQKQPEVQRPKQEAKIEMVSNQAQTKQRQSAPVVKPVAPEEQVLTPGNIGRFNILGNTKT